MVRVDADALAGVRLGQPGEFHDGAAGGGEDGGLDQLNVSVDSQAFTADEGEFSERDSPSPIARLDAPTSR